MVALDLATGREVWKFQTVHHDPWDDEENNVTVTVTVTVEMRMPTVPKLLRQEDVTADTEYTGESGPFAPQTGTPYARLLAMFLSHLNIPCIQPPRGTITGIGLASGAQIRQYPAGTARDAAFGSVQPGPALHVGFPPLGGPMVAKGEIAWFAGTQDCYLRDFDTTSGDLLWEGRLPVGMQSNPISYIGRDGRQYVVVSASGARCNMSTFCDYVIAFALPREG